MLPISDIQFFCLKQTLYFNNRKKTVWLFSMKIFIFAYELLICKVLNVDFKLIYQTIFRIFI